MLEKITPVILTLNEEKNIERCVSKLQWARRVLVVDSFSEDRTLEILSCYPNVEVHQREFDCFANQWRFALEKLKASDRWVLALDADYILSEKSINELRSLEPNKQVSGFRARFVYCIGGRPLKTCIYPPVTVLFNRSDGEFYQDGHAYRLRCRGQIEDLREPLYHDDRKPHARWLRNQWKYAADEAEKIHSTAFQNLALPDKIRSLRIIAPPGMAFYCLFVKGLVFEGWPGLRYSLERFFAELLLSIRLCMVDIKKARALFCGKEI